jgi:hypothetical protein
MFAAVKSSEAIHLAPVDLTTALPSQITLFLRKL